MSERPAASHARTVLWILLAVLLLTGGSYGAVYVYGRRAVIRQAESQLRAQLLFIGQLLQGPLLEHRLSTVTETLEGWGRDHADLVLVRAIAPNGAELFRFDRRKPGVLLRDRREIRIGGRLVLTIEAEQTISARAGQALRVVANLLVLTVIVTFGVAGAIWEIVKRTALLPLEAEMARREEAVKELDAFTYSVSHDLRAPLRGIDGFSHVLLEDYGDKLDDLAKEHLQRVRDGCARMGRLIDDLLNLSRLGRAALRCERVDLSGMAEAILGELRAGAPDRSVELVVAPGVFASGDASLLHVALSNLLGNAWKFTRGRARARIEFGVQAARGGRVYFVRDDGAGFDMRYASALFTPFQRLHSSGEFEGSGIGLATVQRILSRHGGRIWAEGHVGKGAVFYFTLPGG